MFSLLYPEDPEESIVKWRLSVSCFACGGNWYSQEEMPGGCEWCGSWGRVYLWYWFWQEIIMCAYYWCEWQLSNFYWSINCVFGRHDPYVDWQGKKGTQCSRCFKEVKNA